YLRGTLIPFGTRIQILEVRKDSVTFKAAGHPPITLTLRDGARSLTLDQYLDRVFPPDDPYARLPKLPPDGKQAAEVDKTRRMIEEGPVSVGMTREQVLMAIGYPPADRTPALDAPSWKYWANRGATSRLTFAGAQVRGVGGQPEGPG